MPLSVFPQRHPTASQEIRERTFPFFGGCGVANRKGNHDEADFASTDINACRLWDLLSRGMYNST